MTNRTKCIIFDVDGTVANLEHRRHFVTGGKKDWVSFDAVMHLDTPIPQTIEMNKMFNNYTEYPIFVVSGRADNMKAVTEKWLFDNSVDYDGIFMRKHGDYRADHIIKKEILEHIRSIGYEPWIIFDDRESVTNMWREEGLFVFQCDPNPSETHHDIYLFHEHIEYPLTIMVGPSGAGKSTILKYYIMQDDIDTSSVISSDALRAMITGDFRSQEENDRVFEVMHKLASDRLRMGLPVVLDATHIKNAARIAAAKLLPPEFPVRYMVVDRPLEEKKLSGGWRNEVMVKGKTLIEYHDQAFKSNLKDILKGDNLPNVTVTDCRKLPEKKSKGK